MTTMKGKRVLVTAGAGGIGRAIAEAFSTAGASSSSAISTRPP